MTVFVGLKIGESVFKFVTRQGRGGCCVLWVKNLLNRSWFAVGCLVYVYMCLDLKRAGRLASSLSCTDQAGLVKARARAPS